MTMWLFTLILAVAVAMSGTPAGAVALAIDGPAEAVTVWASDRCAGNDIPDAAARAFRDTTGQVHLFAAHFLGRALTGPRLDVVKPDCRIAFQGAANDDPAAFDDRIWLTSFFTTDGKRVHALGHAEYHGHLRRRLCPSGRYMECWWNAVVQVVSTDGGATFHRLTGEANGLVAALPYRYVGEHGQPAGYFSPSNIIAKEGFFYTFVFASSYGAQKRGACLLRTDRLDDPSSWRAWDGSDFRVSFVDAYTDDAARPQEHVCMPVPGISSTINSVSRLDGSGNYVALLAAARPAVPGGASVAGIYYAISSDLLHWTEPRLLMAVPIMFAFDCDAGSVYAYPSLLDENSSSRTFETVGRAAFLYLTRTKTQNCRLTMDRDLVRFAVTVKDTSVAAAQEGQ